MIVLVEIIIIHLVVSPKSMIITCLAVEDSQANQLYEDDPLNGTIIDDTKQDLTPVLDSDTPDLNE